MSSYTRVSSAWWHWEELVDCDPTTRLLWLGLYSTGEAKRIVPGLWHGGISTMAEASRLPADEVIRCLDKLLERDLAEYDPKLRVLRLTQLPDPGESPTNGNTIRGWWNKFKSVPACQVRDAHVTTLRWIMDEWARENGKAISADHESAWAETFGNPAKVQVPPPRKRGVRRLMESDTSNARQPSLFGSSVTLSDKPYPQGEDKSVDNSDSLHQPKEIRDSETLSKGFRKEQDQDQDREKDLGSSFLISAEGRSRSSRPPTPELPDLGATVRAERDQAVPATGKPVLTLVPPGGPFTADQLIEALSLGRGLRVEEAQRTALQRAITAPGAIPVGIDNVLAVLTEYGPRGLTFEQATTPGAMRRLIQNAFDRKREGEARAAMLAEAKVAGPYKW